MPALRAKLSCSSPLRSYDNDCGGDDDDDDDDDGGGDYNDILSLFSCQEKSNASLESQVELLKPPEKL